MKKLLLLCLLLATSCGSADDETVVNDDQTDEIASLIDPMQNSTQEEKETITFEVEWFEFSHNKTKDGSFYTESYEGTGTVIAKGDTDLINKPYIVLLDIIRISGGSASEGITSGSGIQNIIVTNGRGHIRTFDSTYREEVLITKPTYEFKIIGYIPYTEL